MATLLLGTFAAATLCHAHRRRREAAFGRRLTLATRGYFS